VPDNGKIIYINENNLYQQIDGFGASMTDSSAWLIYTQLNESQRTGVMNALFSPTDGIGISITRIPMGASDFVNGDAYTYDDMPPGQTDPELAHFSIDHDRTYIIPALQDAMKINPSLKVMASPWSAPAWMKTSDELGNGSLLPEFYPVFANYFVKFIQAYEAENIPIYAITLQNEPHHEPYSYPGMRMEQQEAADFVKNHLGPALEAAGIETKILIWDHNWDEYDYPITVLNDSDAKAFVDGVAFHCYGGTVIAQGIVHDTHPDTDIYFTECSGGAWIPNFAEGIKRDMKDLVMGSTRNWAKTIIKWNLALDGSFGPHNGGCGNCYGFVTITPETETGFSYSYDYYSIGHASKFVTPGAYRIASTSYQYDRLLSGAFLNPDDSKALIVSNSSTTEKSFTVRW
jgi:glucosylceramidase